MEKQIKEIANAIGSGAKEVIIKVTPMAKSAGTTVIAGVKKFPYKKEVALCGAAGAVGFALGLAVAKGISECLTCDDFYDDVYEDEGDVEHCGEHACCKCKN